jgi:prepilin-type N-terminal cleavage/methylation domain-containing protein
VIPFLTAGKDFSMDKKHRVRGCVRAFTLIELLVVIAIIAVLMGILMPALSMAREQSRRAVCASNLRGFGMSVVTYAADHDEKIPPAFYQNGASPYRCYMLFEIDEAKPWGEHIRLVHNLGRLYTEGYIKTGKAYYCPSAVKVTEDGDVSGYYYEAYRDAGHDWPWKNTHADYSGGSDDNVRGGYNYIPQSKTQKAPVNGGSLAFPVMARSTLQLDSAAAMATDFFNNINSLAHKKGLNGGGGLNVLYSDGSLQFRNDSEAFDPILWEKSINVPEGEFRFRSILDRLQR